MPGQRAVRLQQEKEKKIWTATLDRTQQAYKELKSYVSASPGTQDFSTLLETIAKYAVCMHCTVGVFTLTALLRASITSQVAGSYRRRDRRVAGDEMVAFIGLSTDLTTSAVRGYEVAR